MSRRMMGGITLFGGGVALSMPPLASADKASNKTTSGDKRDSANRSDRRDADAPPRRMVCINNALGLHLPHFVPKQSGRDYAPSRYLNVIDHLRDDYTVISGVSHPEVDGGHAAEKSFLTTAPHPGSGSFRNTISLDQLAAEQIGRQTRFPSLVLAATGDQSLSWTRAGVPIPGETSPSRLFEKLFMAGSPEQIERRKVELEMGRSIMDAVGGQAKSLHRKLNPDDRQKLDEYLTSVREVEQQMTRGLQWQDKPKPKVAARKPRDIRDRGDVTGRAKLMYDLTHLALRTDSTRVVTIAIQGFFIQPPLEGVNEGYHTLSHHGMNRQKLEQLAIIECEQLRVLGGLLEKLKSTREGDGTLLDSTMVLYGSNLGNASSHDNRNLPTILAGGGFRHGSHLKFDPSNNRPLADLFVSMLQRLDIPRDRFGTGQTTLPGLEMTA